MALSVSVSLAVAVAVIAVPTTAAAVAVAVIAVPTIAAAEPATDAPAESAIADPTGRALTGRTDLTEYPNATQARVLKDGYKRIATSVLPGVLAAARAFGDRTEIGWSFGGHGKYFPHPLARSGTVRPAPGLTLGVFGKHLVADGGSFGLALAGQAGGIGFFSDAGPVWPVFGAIPMSVDFGPRNSLTVMPVAGGTFQQNVPTPAAAIAAAYEWRMAPWASFLLLDDLNALSFENKATLGLRFRHGEQFYVTTELLRLTSPLWALEAGIVGLELAWVGDPEK